MCCTTHVKYTLTYQIGTFFVLPLAHLTLPFERVLLLQAATKGRGESSTSVSKETDGFVQTGAFLNLEHGDITRDHSNSEPLPTAHRGYQVWGCGLFRRERFVVCTQINLSTKWMCSITCSLEACPALYSCVTRHAYSIWRCTLTGKILLWPNSFDMLYSGHHQ